MKKTIAWALGCALGVALPRVAAAAPRVWVIDDGEKVKRDATALRFADGTDDPVWAPSQPVRLFAMRNETVALQVVVQADAAALAGVTVDFDQLVGPGGARIANAPGATDPARFVGRPIERFVEHYFQIQRPSGGNDPTSSLGWYSGSGPTPSSEWTGWVPDALIPVEAAPSWDPYPMNVAASSNGVVWIDVTVPAGQPAGTYAGSIAVVANGQPLAAIPVELEVVAATLPDRPVSTMLYYDPSELSRRIGDAAAEAYLFQLLHRHRLSAMHGAETTSDVTRQIAALDGSLFTAQNGYEGPGVGQGDGILSLGTYGSYGSPSSTSLSKVESIADLVAGKGLFGSTDVFVYAIDESCGSSYGSQWKNLLAGSTDPNAKKVLVGWTCSTDPSKQVVDVPMVIADSYDPKQIAAARALGKRPWIYNGVRPASDAFFTDTAAVALRANGWIAGAAGIERWFYWETTFWYDDNHGGHGAYDPFVTAETFHNADGDWCEGDGVLLYPGKQVDVFTDHSVGLAGVLASIRLKNLRRGIEDAGYYQLAHAAAPQKAEAIAAALLGRTLSSSTAGHEPTWSETGKAWFDARAALLALVPREATGGAGDAGAAGGDAGVGVPGGVDAGVPAGNGDGSGDGAAPAADGEGAGCASGGRAPGGPWVALVAIAGLAFAAARRRR